MGLFGPGKKDDNSSNQLPTSLMLMMRIIVGLYLAYLAYSLYGEKGPSEIPRTGLLIIAGVFLVAGGIIIFFAVRDLLSGNFQGGSKDTSSDAEGENTSSDTVTEEQQDTISETPEDALTGEISDDENV